MQNFRNQLSQHYVNNVDNKSVYILDYAHFQAIKFYTV